MKRIALLSASLLLVPAGWALGRAVGANDDPYGGAFTGPCTYQPHSAKGPAAKLVLTDYGPPVSVGHITVADYDASGARVSSTRVTVGTESDLIVGHRQTHTFLVPAPSSTTSCKLVGWGESTRGAAKGTTV